MPRQPFSIFCANTKLCDLTDLVIAVGLVTVSVVGGRGEIAVFVIAVGRAAFVSL